MVNCFLEAFNDLLCVCGQLGECMNLVRQLGGLSGIQIDGGQNSIAFEGLLCLRVPYGSFLLQGMSRDPGCIFFV